MWQTIWKWRAITGSVPRGHFTAKTDYGLCPGAEATYGSGLQADEDDALVDEKVDSVIHERLDRSEPRQGKERSR